MSASFGTRLKQGLTVSEKTQAAYPGKHDRLIINFSQAKNCIEALYGFKSLQVGKRSWSLVAKVRPFSFTGQKPQESASWWFESSVKWHQILWPVARPGSVRPQRKIKNGWAYGHYWPLAFDSSQSQLHPSLDLQNRRITFRIPATNWRGFVEHRNFMPVLSWSQVQPCNIGQGTSLATCLRQQAKRVET